MRLIFVAMYSQVVGHDRTTQRYHPVQSERVRERNAIFGKWLHWVGNLDLYENNYSFFHEPT